MIKITKDQRKKVFFLAKEFRLDFVILYGSQAKGQAGVLSDLDLAIYRQGGLSGFEFAEIYKNLISIFPQIEVDLKSLSQVNPLFRYYITRDGQLLYGEKTAYNSFKAFSYRDYQEAKPLFLLKAYLVNKHQAELSRLYL